VARAPKRGRPAGKRGFGGAARLMQLTKGKSQDERARIQKQLSKLAKALDSTLQNEDVGKLTPLPLEGNKFHTVCCAAELGLHHEATPRCIRAALRRLRNATQSRAPRVVLLNELVHFDNSCLLSFMDALAKQPGIFAVNVGDCAAAAVEETGWSRLVRYLQGPGGARILCQYFCDTHCPDHVRQDVREYTGKTRREQTEKEARKLIAMDKIEEARVVPWRTEAVHNALNASRYGSNVKWGMPTWHPRKFWPELS